MNFFVDAKMDSTGDGSKNSPFKTISEAARIAMPGDEVIVAPGIYREYVDPQNPGLPDKRIVYKSEVMGKAIITGAEKVSGWVKVEGSVWKTSVDNKIFEGNNPFTKLVSGDWFIAYFVAHLGEVYLNGKSMYEATSLEDVKNPKKSIMSWDPEFSLYTWYSEQNEVADSTEIYANFHEYDPNDENIEINVRENCFYPSKEGVGYITLSGFVVKQAATQWAPPTAYQEGMIGPHWSKGWIIEDCEISDSKCSGISLGKYLQKNNDNKWLKWKYKDGTQTERDCICQAQVEGWTKERIGSHIVRRCNIHDCGQTGIVGHLGGVFSIIEDNHIHHINNKQNLAGAEIGGIKMHAAIDVIIRRNNIHDCTRGLWLDWQAQGTRVTQNFFYNNTLPNPYNVNPQNTIGTGEDIFVEVSHGPTLIDNNVLLSDCALRLSSQGMAIVHNLIAGSLTAVGQGVNNGTLKTISPRYTPYHMIHRTEIAGFMTILHGDVRFLNNIFVQKEIREGMPELAQEYAKGGWSDLNIDVGTHPYDEYPTMEEYDKLFEGYCGMGSPLSDRYYLPLPVVSEGNVFFNGAKPCNKEKDSYVDTEHTIKVEIEEIDGKPKLKTNLYDVMPKVNTALVDTNRMGIAFEPEELFENPDGTPIVCDEDLFGNKRGEKPMPGPFEKK